MAILRPLARIMRALAVDKVHIGRVIVDRKRYLQYHDKPGAGDFRDRPVVRVDFLTGHSHCGLDIEVCVSTFMSVLRQGIFVKVYTVSGICRYKCQSC